MSTATLLFLSSLLAIPACAAAAWIYARWSAGGTMAAYAGLTVVALASFAILGTDSSRLPALAKAGLEGLDHG